jgi:hypothetical protein
MEQLTLDSQSYSLVKARRYSPDYQIYQGNNRFLRIGPADEVDKELARHRELLGLGFPVAQLLGEGIEGNRRYYYEESMGETHLGRILASDYSETGRISDEPFSDLLGIATTYANAQIKSARIEDNLDEFAQGYHLDFILEERPDIKAKIDEVFGKVHGKIKGLPFVLTHGDFNAHNLFPKGVIDLEYFHYAPLGYDLTSALFHPYFFSPSGTESNRTYAFTAEQEQKYFDSINAIFRGHGLPNLTEYTDEYILCRAVFACVRMQSKPVLMKWRYDLFDKLLDEYLAGKKLSIKELASK